MAEESHNEVCQGCAADRLTDADRAFPKTQGWIYPGHTCGTPDEIPPRPQQRYSVNTHVPIPYGGHHVGPRRTLTIVFRQAWFSQEGVHVNIDDSSYVLPWGMATFEVPADRPVNINVHQMSQGKSHSATSVLTSERPAELEYSSHGYFGRFSIGPPRAVPGPLRQPLIPMITLSLEVTATLIALFVALAIIICLGIILLFAAFGLGGAM
jgi:hypothetical protein